MGRAVGGSKRTREACDMKLLVVPLLCLAFLAAASAESESELGAQLTDDELVDSLLQDLKPLEDEYDADSRADKADSGKDAADLGSDEETDILDILDKELGPLMSGKLDPEERLLEEELSDRGFRSRWKRYRRKWKRSIRKRVRKVRRSVSKRYKKLRNSVSKRYKKMRNSIRKRIRGFTGIFRKIGDVIRRVRGGMRKVNYFWKMIKDIRGYMRNYAKRRPPPNRIAAIE